MLLLIFNMLYVLNDFIFCRTPIQIQGANASIMIPPFSFFSLIFIIATRVLGGASPQHIYEDPNDHYEPHDGDYL